MNYSNSFFVFLLMISQLIAGASAGKNLALNQNATASSLENDTLIAANAVDGDLSTRWASAFSDPQWIMIDLGKIVSVGGIVINWEPAFAAVYDIQVAIDTSDWKTVCSIDKGRGGLDSLAFNSTDAQYVRMFGTVRSTSFGYSLYEFEVYSELTVSPKIEYPNTSLQIFEQVTEGHMVTSVYPTFGISWIDYNLDGYLDFLSVTPVGDDYLYQNDGSGQFNYVNPKSSGLNAGGLGSGITWGDYDNDGDPDPFIPIQNGKNKLYRNDATGCFVEIQNQSIVTDNGNTFDAAWVDYDNDGWLDLLATNCATMGAGPGTSNFLYHNNGDGTFTRILAGPIAEELGNTSSSNWIDYDNDGDIDLFTPEWGLDNKLYQNKGDGTFIKITEGIIVNDGGGSISSTWGDYDNDGDFDLFIANGYPIAEKDFLYKNNGDGTFTKVLEGSIANNIETSWNAQWGDLDNDGDLDLYVVTLSLNHLLYLNNGDGTFIQVVDDPSVSKFSASSSAVWGDIDNDGDLDLAVAEINGHPGTLLLKNPGNENHWLNVKCEGTVSNRSALGAVIRVKADINGKPVWLMRHISASNGFRCQSNGLRAHFGLGDATVVDSLMVRWPSGLQTVQTKIKVDQFLHISEPFTKNYIRPAFTANKNKGMSKLTVQFKDASVSDPDNPITSWAWDFNNDGIIDSYEKNPENTFQASIATTFTVKLIVSNGVQKKTYIRRDFIQLQGHVSILDFESDILNLGNIGSLGNSRFIFTTGVMLPAKF